MGKKFFTTLILTVLLLELILILNLFIGAVLYTGIILIALIAASKAKISENKVQIISAASSILIIRVAVLFLNLDLFFNLITAYSLLSVAAIFYTRKFKKSGLKVKRVGWAVLAAVLLGYAGSVIIELEKEWIFLAIVPLIAFSEETLFRGVILNAAEKEKDEESAVMFTSLFYAILFISHGIIPALFFFVAALIFGVIYVHIRSLPFMMLLNLILHCFVFFFRGF
jgi:membrane protease YdiL (CAAX protease family)